MFTVKQRARQRITRQARTVEFTVEALLHLLQLLAQQLAQLRMILEGFTGSSAQQHRQGSFQRMPQVAEGVAGALEAVFGVRQQVVDLRHQGLQLKWHLSIELRALALLQLSDLVARGLQRAQGTAHRDPLQNQHQ